MSRWLPVILAAVVLALFVAQPAMAAATHEGKVVTAANGKLTMTDKEGKNQATHTVSPTARISCDGKACKLEDLKAGFTVKVTVDKAIDGKEQAVQIAATSKAEPPK
ncbi:MAG: hypothetical protein HYS13_15580 [Planctomycetia bacterium]|nr:hypothetical protein [Planctomycetia bacterium]